MGRRHKQQKPEADRESVLRPVAGPAMIAVLAVAAAGAGVAPGMGGPGVTCDELQNVVVGKALVTAWRNQGVAFFKPANIRRNFPWTPDGPPFHPPLANWALGWTHHLFDPEPDETGVMSIGAARFASALALGLTALVVGLATLRIEGAVAGTVAAAAVVLVPRTFAHGQLAGLDMITALTLTSAVLAVAEADARRGAWWQYALAGVAWGLAMLTRLHGVLLLPPVVVWLVWRRRRKALVPLAAWGAAGGLTLFAGWPWLWLSPFHHLKMFLMTGTARQALHTFYFGRVWLDRDVPWHYPAVMFLATLPAGLLLLGLLGLWAKRRMGRADPGLVLVIGVLGLLLLVFALPGTPVYDGVRLFLAVFPLWAVLVGVGARWVVEHRLWHPLASRWRLLALGGFVALQGVGIVVYRGCPLSHYNLLVGGLPGAARLGFEVTYWGDVVQEPLLSTVAHHASGRVVVYGPNLAPYQAPAVLLSSPALLESEVRLVGWDASWTQPPPGCLHGVFYCRRADLGVIPPPLLNARVLAEHRNQGVWLARLVEFGASAR